MGNVRVFENARVLTMDAALPHARGVVVSDGLIVSLDPDDAAPGATRIDCQGKTLIPGFVDTHIHLHAFAKKAVGNDMSVLDAPTIASVRGYVGALCKKTAPGEWVTIFGYDPYRIAERRLLTRWDIDEVSREHPVRMYHRSGQGQLCNSKALEVMGINIESEDPDGGMIDREVPSGEPSGMLYGMDDFISAFVTPEAAVSMDDAAAAAGTILSKQGITCVHDATLRNDFGRLDTLENWHERGLVPQRLRCMIGIDEFMACKDELSQHAGGHASFYGVKLILNEIRGWLNIDTDTLVRHFAALEEASIPGMIHCVDETQLEAALDAIEYARNAHPGRGVPHRIEHVSLCSDQMVARMARLGVLASSQPAFLYYSGERYLDTIPGEDVLKLYRFGSLMHAGINVSFSSDAPIAPVRSFKGIYSAVTRQSEAGRTVCDAEGVDVLDALRMYTLNGARAVGMDDVTGSLVPGKYADMVLLDTDPLTCEVEGLQDVGVEMTVIGGEIAWQA